MSAGKGLTCAGQRCMARGLCSRQMLQIVCNLLIVTAHQRPDRIAPVAFEPIIAFKEFATMLALDLCRSTCWAVGWLCGATLQAGGSVLRTAAPTGWRP